MKVFSLNVEGKVENRFFMLYTQAFYQQPANLVKGLWAPPVCHMGHLILPFLSSNIKVLVE